MASKNYNISWVQVYREDNNSYVGGTSPIRVGSEAGYNSFIGIPSAVRDALNTSSTATRMYLNVAVSNSSAVNFAIGRHKLSSAPTSSTMPWYNYSGLYPSWGAGWQRIDITDQFKSGYLDGTYQGLVLYNSPNEAYGEAHGINGAFTAFIEVTGTWNTPPSMPVITYPKGGEVVDSSLTMTWNASTDSNGDPVTYQVAITDNNEKSWTYINLGSVTSYTFNTSALAQTSQAKVAIRSSDGQEWSAWRESNYFTIYHNKAPLAPIQMSPASGTLIDRTLVNRFSWKHNDDGAQASYQLGWRTVASDGTRGGWVFYPSGTTYANSTDQFYNYASNTFPLGQIEWTVRTKDQQGLLSPWGEYQLVIVGAPSSSPIMLTPTASQVVGTNTIGISWSSSDQTNYEVYLLDSTGVTTLWSQSGTVEKAVYPEYVLSNNTTYQVKLRIMSTGIWSAYVITTFTTSFTPPAPPIIRDIEQSGEGVINVLYTAGDLNILPDFLLADGSRDPRIIDYSVGANESVTITGVDSFRVTSVAGQTAGIEYNLYSTTSDLTAGKVMKLIANTDLSGVRIGFFAYDSNEVQISSMNSSVTLATSATLTYTIPANCYHLRIYFYISTSAPSQTTNFTGCRLWYDTTAVTNSIELYRREYTPTGSALWTRIAESSVTKGSFLDYTFASNTPYEYKLQAINSSAETIHESLVKIHTQEFTGSFLQEANNLEALLGLNLLTAKEHETEIESTLQRFAGRVLPVREYGEHESTQLTLEWEVDTWYEVKLFEGLLKSRGVLLFRDGIGRRYWLTFDKLGITDKLNGFELSADFEVTSYIEEI